MQNLKPCVYDLRSNRSSDPESVIFLQSRADISTHRFDLANGKQLFLAKYEFVRSDMADFVLEITFCITYNYKDEIMHYVNANTIYCGFYDSKI